MVQGNCVQINQSVQMPLVRFSMWDHAAYREHPQLLGMILNWYLYGIFTLQTYYYHLAFPRDNEWTRTLVYSLYVLETAHAIVVTIGYSSYNSFFGNPYDLPLTKTTTPAIYPMYSGIPAIGGIVALITNSMYARRVLIITQSKILAWVLYLLAGIQFVAAIVFVITSTLGPKAAYHQSGDVSEPDGIYDVH
ncbi:hypothetical protein AMATHDRAFT_7162 [Amanita thiersii Skay4041]|uniref:Uncharacterized protein n=1 Tax=Amanita thiersii Skay4041 TaxID=703135 RepID=A0A2A9NFH0_9AGAR|nr:hypothetical protein AMATHDRAFT_7162 [Amanita thiersii Skay4041]